MCEIHCDLSKFMYCSNIFQQFTMSIEIYHYVIVLIEIIEQFLPVRYPHLICVTKNSQQVKNFTLTKSNILRPLFQQ